VTTRRPPRPGTDDATRVRMVSGDDQLAAALLPALDDHAGPARRLPQAKAAAIVTSIVDLAMKEGPIAEASPTPSGASRPAASPRRLAPILAAALVVAAVVGAAAAVVTTRYLSPARPEEAAPPTRPRDVPAPMPAPAEPEEVVIDVPVIIEDPPARTRKDRDRETRESREPRGPRDKIDLPPDAPAEDILALANQRRKERAWKDADALYRRVIKQYPRSDAAVVAEVASATIHLEHLGDANGALAGYRRALAARPAGALGEEARWGIAEAFRAVGDTKGEDLALRVFLDTHPHSAMASAARKRLAELQ